MDKLIKQVVDFTQESLEDSVILPAQRVTRHHKLLDAHNAERCRENNKQRYLWHISTNRFLSRPVSMFALMRPDGHAHTVIDFEYGVDDISYKFTSLRTLNEFFTGVARRPVPKDD